MSKYILDNNKFLKIDSFDSFEIFSKDNNDIIFQLNSEKNNTSITIPTEKTLSECKEIFTKFLNSDETKVFSPIDKFKTETYYKTNTISAQEIIM